MHEPHHPPLPALRRRYREDGWTRTVQRQFIEALAESGSVAKACEQVSRSTSTAYRLRGHPDAHEFRAAWNAATAMAYRQVFELAMDRIVGGQESPIFHDGMVIGHRVVHSDRLICFMLDHLRPRDVPETGTTVTRSGADGQDVALGHALEVLDDANGAVSSDLRALESIGGDRWADEHNARQEADDLAALPPPVPDPVAAQLAAEHAMHARTNAALASIRAEHMPARVHVNRPPEGKSRSRRRPAESGYSIAAADRALDKEHAALVRDMGATLV